MTAEAIVFQTRARAVWSWVEGRHCPRPYFARDGRWRCRDCGMILTRYLDNGKRRLRHHPRGKR